MRRNLVTLLGLALAAASFAVISCEADSRATGHNSGSSGDGGTDDETTGTPTDNGSTDTEFANADGGVQATGCDSMDILFVIDNSESMREEQESLIASFPQFINVLQGYKNPGGETVDFRVGVTTTGIARKFKETNGIMQNPSDTYSIWCESSYENCVQDGVLQGQEKCGLAKPWMESTSPSLEQSFACTAEVGIKGSWMEMPFGAIDLALGAQSEAGEPNEGFYRKAGNSLLVVVIITDEDDCTVEEGGVLYTATEDWMSCDGTKGKGVYQSADMKSFLDDLAGGEDRYVVVGITGPGPKKCESEFGIAKDGRRVREFIESCKNSVFGDICAGDLSSALDEALELMTVTCDSLPPIV